MSHIEVRPDALDAAAAALARAGDAIADIAAELSSVKGAGEAAAQPDAAAAFNELAATWTHELRAIAHGVETSGRATANARSAYVETDAGVIPGPGR